MTDFIESENRKQATLLPERLDDYTADNSHVRVVDAFIDKINLKLLGFKTDPEDTGRPGYHPATLLKIYIYGYLNRIQSSRRLEREAQRSGIQEYRITPLYWLRKGTPVMISTLMVSSLLLIVFFEYYRGQ